MPTTSIATDRYLVASAVLLTCVLFTAQAADPVNVIKLTALLLVAIAVVCTSAFRVVRYRVVELPVGVAGAAGALLLVAFVASAAIAPVTTTAVLGAYGRNSGLLAYSAALVLFFAGLRVFGRPHAQVLVGGIVVAGLFTASYGLLQKAGIDAIAWNNPFNPIIAALGNPNFASAYLGIAAAVGAGGAFYPRWARPLRLASGITSVLCLLAAGLSSSVQGSIAAAAGLFVVTLAISLELRSSRKPALLILAGLAATGVTVLVMGAIARAGPAAVFFTDVGSRARGYYWSAALEMFRGAPLTGVGLDQYGKFWRTARSPDSVAGLGGSDYSDAAHSVPLQMLAQGGLFLGVAYMLFAGVTLFFLVRGLLRLTGADRLLLGAVGGGWVAYQVQSAVSIDQVPLLVLHFSLAGAVVATAGGSAVREISLPGAARAAVPYRNGTRTQRRVASAPPVRAMTVADVAVLSLIGALMLVAAWQALVPLRANAAIKDGDLARSLGDGTAAFLAYDRATNLVAGQAEYWIKKGQLFERATPPQTAQALLAYGEAIERDPYVVGAMLAMSRLAEQDGDLDTARHMFRLAAVQDPINPDTLVAAAGFELRHRGAEQARALLEAAVRAIPGSAVVWATLGDARAVSQDSAGAREAYERALQLEPGQLTAIAGLDKLGT